MLLNTFLVDASYNSAQTEYLIHAVSNTSLHFRCYQFLPWKYLWWSLFLQLLNVTHRCYHTTFTSSNGFEHPLHSHNSPNSKFFSNGRWNKAPGTFSTSHWFPSCLRSRFAVLIYSKVTDFQLQPVSYYHCWAGERQSI